MKKIIVLTICILLLFTGSIIANENGYYEGVTAGERRAEREHSSTMYWILGTPSAFLLTPLLGGTATIATAYLTSPGPDTTEMRRLEGEGHSTDYIRGFEAGYEDIAQSKNVRAAWGATGVAFLARLVIIAGVNGQTYLDDPFENNPLQPSQIPAISFEF